MSQDTYEENKRLRAENQLLRDKEKEDRSNREKLADEVVDLTLVFLKGFFTGSKSFQIYKNEGDGSFSVYVNQ